MPKVFVPIPPRTFRGGFFEEDRDIRLRDIFLMFATESAWARRRMRCYRIFRKSGLMSRLKKSSSGSPSGPTIKASAIRSA